MRRAELKELIDQGLATNAPFRLKRAGDRTRIRRNMRDRCGGDVHEVALDDVEAFWPLA